MTPMISVVMPVYNCFEYLDDAIESILNQTYRNFEFIIIDDGSTDDSLKIIKKYQKKDSRISLVSRENRGLTASLNEGIEKAQGKFIARMDADDISLPKRFENQIVLMEKENLDICGCHFFVINLNSEYVDCVTVPLRKKSFLNYLSITTPFAHPSIMIKKQFLMDNSLFYGQTRYKDAEDYVLWIEFWNRRAKFGNVDEFLFKYRNFTSSLSKKNKKNISKNKREISKKFILSNKKTLLENFKSFEPKLLSKNEQELIVLIIMFLIKYDFSIRYFSFFKKINNRALLFGLLQFFRERY